MLTLIHNKVKKAFTLDEEIRRKEGDDAREKYEASSPAYRVGVSRAVDKLTQWEVSDQKPDEIAQEMPQQESWEERARRLERKLDAVTWHLLKAARLISENGPR